MFNAKIVISNKKMGLVVTFCIKSFKTKVEMFYFRPMKRSLTLFVLFVGMSFLFASCGSTDAAEKTATKFFKLLIKGDFKKANTFISAGFDPDVQLQQISRLGKNDTAGKLLSAKKTMGFNTNITNGITTVKLPYLLKYEKSELSVEVTLVNRGSGFKIQSIN